MCSGGRQAGALGTWRVQEGNEGSAGALRCALVGRGTLQGQIYATSQRPVRTCRCAKPCPDGGKARTKEAWQKRT
eukprot:1156904-Pelagomonas_calceolata.AAC.4